MPSKIFKSPLSHIFINIRDAPYNIPQWDYVILGYKGSGGLNIREREVITLPLLDHSLE